MNEIERIGKKISLGGRERYYRRIKFRGKEWTIKEEKECKREDKGSAVL